MCRWTGRRGGAGEGRGGGGVRGRSYSTHLLLMDDYLASYIILSKKYQVYNAVYKERKVFVREIR